MKIRTAEIRALIAADKIKDLIGSPRRADSLCSSKRCFLGGKATKKTDSIEICKISQSDNIYVLTLYRISSTLSRIFYMSANIFQSLGASLASRRLRAANISAKINETVAGIGLFILRDRIGQYALDLERILEILGIKPESAANSDTMRIRNDTGNAENVAEKKICDLATDPGEFT